MGRRPPPRICPPPFPRCPNLSTFISAHSVCPATACAICSRFCPNASCAFVCFTYHDDSGGAGAIGAVIARDVGEARAGGELEMLRVVGLRASQGAGSSKAQGLPRLSVGPGPRVSQGSGIYRPRNPFQGTPQLAAMDFGI